MNTSLSRFASRSAFLLAFALMPAARAGEAEPLLPDFVAADGGEPATAEGRVLSSPTTVDILVAYTPAARTYAGGANAMVAAINTHIALANTCYANSDIPITLRAVAVVETNYVEASSFDTDLTRLQGTTDGYMDELHTLRTNYGADLVALIRRNSAAGVAGLAYVNPYTTGSSAFATHAFSVTADVWASGNIAFPHELGHNFGCWHDRQNSSTLTHPSAYGWRFYGNDGQQYITVMAYYPGTRIPYFSNPSINYQGQPTGVASGTTAADNAMRHEVTAPSTAAYRAGALTKKDQDIFWRHADGRMAVWFQSNTVRTGWAFLGSTAGTGWRGVAQADMNADGESDLIFQHTDGRVCIWYMSGVNRTSFEFASLTANTGWNCVAAGDFNSDSKPDLLWQHNDGRIVVWYMNGATANSWALIDLPYAPGWTLRLLTDINGDGQRDLVWQHTDGRVCVWYMSGLTRTGFAFSDATVTAGWLLFGAEDYNGDGKKDLLWFNTSTGRLVVWYMDGINRTSWAWLDATAGAGWTVLER